MLCLYVWARALRESLPKVVIIENVPRFPVALLVSLFGDLYVIDHMICNAEKFGSPARRRRLYAVMTLRGVFVLSRPLSEAVGWIRDAFPHRRSWEMLFCLDGADDGFSAAVRKRSREYLKVFRDRASAYDLDQLPRGRPRRSKAGDPLFALTAHTRNVWSPAEGRRLRRNELAAAMGMPADPALAMIYGMVPLQLEGLSRSAAARLVGNGMSVPCVGAVMWWCAVYCSPAVVAIPGELAARVSKEQIDAVESVDACLPGVEPVDAVESVDASLPGVEQVDAVESVDELTTTESLFGIQPQLLSLSAPLESPHASQLCTGCSTTPRPSTLSATASTWRALGDLGRALCSHGVFAELAATLRAEVRPAERLRELYPLPLVPTDVVASLDGVGREDSCEAKAYFDGVVVGLNWLYGYRGSCISIGTVTAAQGAAHGVIVKAALDLHARLVASFESRDNRGWRVFEEKGEAPRLNLIASAVAVPDCAATCNPAALLSGDLKGAIIDASTIFPTPPAGLDQFPGFYSGDRFEYVALTVRQLRAGLLRLASGCRGGASVFPVGKAEGKQRVVWNGTRVGLAAARPPAPLHLADPAAFGMLDLPAGVQLRVTKRDCKTWFDQLAVDESIGDFFGRPRVSRLELLDAGLTPAEIISCGGTVDGVSFVPCSKVWPMGFSWSSCVAQATLLSICSKAGLTDDRVLACDTSLPNDLDLAFAVATDDLMVFSDQGEGPSVAAAHRVEDVMVRHGIVKNPAKDIDDSLSTTCVGVDLVDGCSWCPPGSRIWTLLDASLDLAVIGRSSRGAVAGYLGVAQWFDLLRRLRLSVFDHVYAFSSGALAKDWTEVIVPSEVIGEILLDMVFALFGKVDMQLPFLPIIAATDASTEYGHGGVVAHASVDDVRRIGRKACKSGLGLRSSSRSTC